MRLSDQADMSPLSRCWSSPRDGKTEITGPVIDQAQLNGLLNRIADLGLTLPSVTPLNTDTEPFP
jgi:hypothetical protein